jgi:hypothetical protein
MNEFDLQLEYQKIINDKIFITNQIDQLDEKIKVNCWFISISFDQVKKVDVENFSALIDQIKENRWKELNQSKVNTNLIFYLWYDEQAGQLRFNFITDRHKNLPFRCELKFVDHQNEILDQFLSSITEIKDEDDASEVFTLKVYQEKIRKYEPPTPPTRQAAG